MKEWLYYLTDADGKSYSVVNGVVKKTAHPKQLEFTPDGWQDIAIAWERNMLKFGPPRNFSLPLGFVMDGAAILRDIFYKKSIEERIFLLIQKLQVEVNTALTPGYFAFLYKYFYKGELDLSTLKDGDTKMICNIMEGGLSKLLKANEATTYEIDVDTDPEAVTIEMDGIYLYETHNFETGVVGTVFDHLVPTLFISKEGQAFGVATFSVYLVESPSISATSDDFFLATEQSINNMQLSGELLLSKPGGTAHNYNLYLKSSLGQNNLITTIALTNDLVSYPFSITFDAQKGEHFWLYADMDTSITGVIYGGSKFSLSYKSKFETTYIKALTPATLFKRLVGKITGNENNADTSYLEAFSRYVITSGDAIRSLSGSKIKTSLNQFFEAFKTILCAGIGIENGKVSMNSVEHYLTAPSGPFAVDDTIHLGKAKSLDVTRSTDLIYNTFKVGYEAKQIDDVNGKYEFNNTHIYTSPITGVVKELQIISPYNAAPYLIEITRINFDGKTTTDSKSDNENFLIDRDTTPLTGDIGTYYALRREAMYIEGVPDPSIFNISLSPKRILLTWSRYINSLFYKMEGQKLTFQTTERNAELKTEQAGVVIQEKADYTITSDRIFLPFYFDFDTEVPTDLVELLETNPNRAFTFEWLSSTFTGFAMKIGIAPNTNKEQAFKLLAAASNDMTKLL